MRWTSWLQTRTFLCWPDCHTENHHRRNYRMAIITRPQLYRFPEGVWQHWLPNPLEHSWALWNSTEDHFSNKALVRGILLSSHPSRNNDCSIPSNNWRKTMMPPISPSLSYCHWLDWKDSLQWTTWNTLVVYLTSGRSRVCWWHLHTITSLPRLSTSSHPSWGNSKANWSLYQLQ